ncbi:hypothetical protein [Planktotalea sp.]|uniref:hypothetical protein n=1 Tax=Planktotalea sp. TaxID=2029877 RepID=UPI003D6C0404
MLSLRALVVFSLAIGAASLPGCRKFPEVEVSEAQFDSKTPYPKLIPFETLLKEPEPSITDEVEEDLTTRRDDLLDTPDADDLEEAKDPVLDRIDALRKRRDEQTTSDPIIDDELRKRLEGGITPPTEPE